MTVFGGSGRGHVVRMMQGQSRDEEGTGKSSRHRAARSWPGQWGRSWVCPCEQVMSSPDVLTPHPGALHGLQASTERGMWGTSSRDSRVGKQAKHQGA